MFGEPQKERYKESRGVMDLCVFADPFLPACDERKVFLSFSSGIWEMGVFSPFLSFLILRGKGKAVLG